MNEPIAIRRANHDRQNHISPGRLLEGERAAAYELGFRSFIIRLAFHNLTLIPLEEDWGVRGLHTDAPVNSSAMELALDDLAEFLDETSARQVRKELQELTNLNEQIYRIATEPPLDRYDQLRQLLSLAHKSWRRLRIGIERAFKETGKLDNWRLMGEAIGRYMLEICQQPIDVMTAPAVTPVIRAAELLRTQDGSRMPLLQSLCDAENIYEEEGPFAFFRAVIRPSRIKFDENGVSESFSVLHYMMLLADEFMAALHVRDIALHDESELGEAASSNCVIATTAMDAGGEITSKDDCSWCHDPSEDRPSTFRFGPLIGYKRDLAAAILSGKQDTRTLNTMGRNKVLWIVKNSRCEYEVWFKVESRYSEAKTRFETPPEKPGMSSTG